MAEGQGLILKFGGAASELLTFLFSLSVFKLI
jgi:hypothetical protein